MVVDILQVNVVTKRIETDIHLNIFSVIASLKQGIKYDTFFLCTYSITTLTTDFFFFKKIRFKQNRLWPWPEIVVNLNCEFLNSSISNTAGLYSGHSNPKPPLSVLEYF